MYFPYYFHRVNKWNHALAMRYDVTKRGKIHLSLLRSGSNRKQLNVRKSFVTHCSYCFNSYDEFRNKLNSFSHQEYNKPPYTTYDWMFKHHYCRITIRGRKGFDESNTDWSQLIPNDPRLSFLYDPSFEFPLNLTSYTHKDLENMCDRKYRRTPFNQKVNF